MTYFFIISKSSLALGSLLFLTLPKMRLIQL